MSSCNFLWKTSGKAFDTTCSSQMGSGKLSVAMTRRQVPHAKSLLGHHKWRNAWHPSWCSNGINHGQRIVLPHVFIQVLRIEADVQRAFVCLFCFFGRTSIDDSHAVGSSTFAITSRYMSSSKAVLTFSQIVHGTFLGACFTGAFSPLRRMWYFPGTRPSSALNMSGYISTSCFLGFVLQ